MIFRLAAEASTIVSSFPATAQPGAAVWVTNNVSPDSGVFVYAVQDTPPAGWAVGAISDAGAFDAPNHTVKWGPFFDGLPRALSYQVNVPANFSGEASFSGLGTFNVSQVVQISGQRAVVIQAAGSNTVVCIMSATFSPGVPLVVTDAVTVVSGVTAYAVEDQLPVGWSATSISDNGIYDPVTQRVKWGPFYDGAARALRYAALSPSNATAPVAFTGTGLFDSAQVPITGQRQTAPAMIAPGMVLSTLPAQYIPGQWLTVTNTTTPAGFTTLFAVEDQPPAGWAVANISNGGTVDPVSQKIRWGPFLNTGPLVLTYAVQAPPDATGTVTFVGTGSFDQTAVPIAGQRQATSVAVFYGSATSRLSSNYAPGVPLIVTNLVTPGSNVTAFAVQDLPPSGWTVSQISSDGAWDPATQEVKWGPFFDQQPRVLTYTVTPPPAATGTVAFAGQVLFDANSVIIGGDRQSTRVTVFAGSVVCALPTTFTAGAPLVVTDSASPPSNTLAWAVQDIIPAGWSIIAISDGGVFDPATLAVKWGPFFDSQKRDLSFQVAPPASPPPSVVFSGAADFDGNIVPITGQRQSLLASPAAQPFLLLNPQRLSSGWFQLDFTNLSGQAVSVLATTNLHLPATNWDVLPAPVAVGGNLYRVQDTNTLSHIRFYRLRSP